MGQRLFRVWRSAVGTSDSWDRSPNPPRFATRSPRTRGSAGTRLHVLPSSTERTPATLLVHSAACPKGHTQSRKRTHVSRQAGNQDDYGNIEKGDALLIGEIAIYGEKNVERGSSQREQFAIPLAGPSHLRNGPRTLAG